MMYGSWDIKCKGQSFKGQSLPFWAIFGPLTCLTAWKMKISKKWKTNPEDIIILHKCNKNHDHMLYCSWYMVRDKCSCYFPFWAIFCPFSLPTAPKMKILKKWKNHLDISSFYTSVPKIIIICYTVPESFYTCPPTITIRWCTVPEIWSTTDRQMDTQTEKVRYRGGCPT